MNTIRVPDMLLYIEFMNKKCGNKSGIQHPSLKGMTVLNLKEELAYLGQQWMNTKVNEEPERFQDILHIINLSLRQVTPLDYWKINDKYELICLRLVVVAAGTSEFA